MKLIEVLDDALHLGFSVTMKKDISSAVITVQKEDYKEESYLPLSDHFYDERVAHCIQFMTNKIFEKEKNK